MTFDDLCDRFDLTVYERREAAFFLAFLRMRKTLEVLLGWPPSPSPGTTTKAMREALALKTRKEEDGS